ncbi:hypothetical protein [Mucilaginibacter oryzae]|uniref:hypothetical protein n=1 Tax=Mucilaginibacter oryzae TaxID=468058 RepID=UPI0011B1C6B0|nr:hypothetical protein [Mucilaginibacter oryzae]
MKRVAKLNKLIKYKSSNLIQKALSYRWKTLLLRKNSGMPPHSPGLSDYAEYFQPVNDKE